MGPKRGRAELGIRFDPGGNDVGAAPKPCAFQLKRAPPTNTRCGCPPGDPQCYRALVHPRTVRSHKTEVPMSTRQTVSRRQFMGGAAATLGYLGLKPSAELWARGSGNLPAYPQEATDVYDSLAKLSFNENPYGPSESALEAMNAAWKYSNRYGYPDGGIQEAIAEHLGVETDNIMIGAGAGEILRVVGLTFLEHDKKVVGVEPSYNQVYTHASGIDAEAILIPLLEDYRQDIPAMIRATNMNHRDVGFVYLCNPNNPTGRTISADEVRQVLDGIPDDVPVLIDEAYHHFVEDPSYETSVPYVLEGRKVIVARTFSKIYGFAGLRLGYAVASPDLIRLMRPYSTGTVNALVKWGGVAALKDTESEAFVRRTTLELRKKTAAELESLGYDVIPSETNFFMVYTGRPVQEVQADFRKRDVLVGRPFPPMLDYLRVSIGTAEEMDRFMTAWREIFPAT